MPRRPYLVVVGSRAVPACCEGCPFTEAQRLEQERANLVARLELEAMARTSPVAPAPPAPTATAREALEAPHRTAEGSS